MNVSAWQDNKPSLSPWQKDFIFNRFDDDLAIACCGISSGKSSALAIWIVLQCCKKPGIRGIITAQTYRALTKVLIQEIRTFCDWAKIDYFYSKGANEIHFGNGSVLFAYSAENPNAVLGLSEISLLAMDEAAYASEEMYNFCADRCRGGKYKTMTRLISSPNSHERVQNWFSELVRKYTNKVVTATAFDNKFTDDDFKQKLKERYIEGSNLYKQQVLGQIIDTDVDSQIIFRDDFATHKANHSTMTFLGMDCSGLGTDSDVIVICDKYGIVESKSMQQASTIDKVAIINQLYDKYKFKHGYLDNTGGYGQGILDLAVAKGLPITGINFAQKAYSEEYPNARTEMYLEAARKIKTDGFYVDDTCKQEFLAQSVTINNRGQQQLVPKDLVKKVLGHSPDTSDACALAIYAMNHSTVKQDDIKHARDIANRYLYLLGAD